MSRDWCRLFSACSRREICRSPLTMASWQGIKATDTDSQGLWWLVGKKKLAIGASTTDNGSTLPTVMLRREGGRKRKREREKIRHLNVGLSSMQSSYKCYKLYWYIVTGIGSYPSVEWCEFCLEAVHTRWGITVRYPNSCMVLGGLLVCWKSCDNHVITYKST